MNPRQTSFSARLQVVKHSPRERACRSQMSQENNLHCIERRRKHPCFRHEIGSIVELLQRTSERRATARQSSLSVDERAIRRRVRLKGGSGGVVKVCSATS